MTQDVLREALKALRRDYLDRHKQSEIDAAEFGPKAGANGRWNARAEGVAAALDILDARSADSLDAAWEQAEATLPDGWSLLIGDERRRGKSGWWATASGPFDEATWGYTIISSSHDGTLYDTPAAALTVLAARLRDRS